MPSFSHAALQPWKASIRIHTLPGSSARSSSTSQKPLSLSPNAGQGLRYLRVVTDIDDTVKSSGGYKIFGKYLGGVDKQYKRGEFYPGAFQFFFELSAFANRQFLGRGTGASASAEKESQKFNVPQVSVLTARAREFLFALALKPSDKLCSAFRKAGQQNGHPAWGVGDVYYGSVEEWIFSERKGLRKFTNFGIMMQNDKARNFDIMPDYIWIGDTGEKDEEAGERIIRQHPNNIRAVFLHVVSDCTDRSKFKLPADRKFDGVPIYYFRTYVDAAKKAMNAGLLDPKGVQRVIKQASDDLSSRIHPDLLSSLSTRHTGAPKRNPTISSKTYLSSSLSIGGRNYGVGTGTSVARKLKNQWTKFKDRVKQRKERGALAIKTFYQRNNSRQASQWNELMCDIEEAEKAIQSKGIL